MIAGQRRAQVVADRAQQRGLQHVAAAQRARLDDVGEQRLALERRREQRLERRDDALAQAAQRRLGHARRRATQRPEPALALAQRERDWRRRRPASSAIAADGSSSAAASRSAATGQRARAARRRAAGRAPSRRRGRPRRGAARPRARAPARRRRARRRRSPRRGRRASATQFSPSAIVKRPAGSTWENPNASAAANAVATASRVPHSHAMNSTDGRYTTLSAMSAATARSG